MKVEEAIVVRPNPFTDCYVDSPWDELEDDVPSMHAPVRKALEDAVATVATTWQSRGILVVGPAGTGKSHLLAWLQKSVSDRALFVAVPPFRDGRRVFRHILRATVDDLLRRRTAEGPRQVDWLLDTLLREIHKSTGVAASFAAFRHQAVATAEASAATVKSIGRFLGNRGIDVDRDVLARFVELESPKRAELAAEWLRGEMLDPEDLAAIGASRPLIPAGATAAVAEEKAREVLGQIGVLSLLFRPLVLVFDRTEALGDTPSMKGIDALTRAICLLHGMPNFVLVTTVEATYWHERVERAMLASHRARVAEDEHFLRGIRGPEATTLVQARMGRVWLGGARPQSATFPFTADFFGVIDAAREDVRSLMARCRFEIDRMHAGKKVHEVGADAASGAPAEALETVVDAYYGSGLRSAKEATVRLDDEEIRDILLRTLETAARLERPIGALRVEMVGRVTDAGFDIGFQPKVGELAGLAVVNSPSTATVVAALEAQLAAVGHGKYQRAFILRRGGARGLRGRAATLEKRLAADAGAVIDLDRHSAAVIVAVGRVLAGATEGDLAPGGRRASPDEAIAALVRSGALDDVPVFRALAEGVGAAAPAANPEAAAAAAKSWIAAAGGSERSAVARADIERSFGELVEQLKVANLAVIEDHLRRAYPALDRETILEVGRDLREKGGVKIVQAAGGSHPVYLGAS